MLISDLFNIISDLEYNAWKSALWPHIKNISYFFPSLGFLLMTPFLLEGKYMPSRLLEEEIYYI